MEATTAQIIVLIFSTLLVLGSSILAYLLSINKDKVWFFSYSMMLIIAVQWLSDTGASLVFHTYFLHLSSVILFPSVIFCLFIVYIFNGLKNARQLLYILLTGELGYMVIIGLLALLGSVPAYINLGWPWVSNHIFSTLAIIVAYFVMISSWPLIHNQKYRILLFIKTFLIIWILLITDTLIFSFGTFYSDPYLYEIIRGNILIRTLITIATAPFITLYIYRKIALGENIEYRSWGDVVSESEHITAIKQSQEKITKLEILEKDLIQKNIDLDEQRKAILNILEDVQHEKNLVTQQADQLRKFQTAASQSNEMMVFADPEGIIEWANQATEAITGFTVKESVGRKAGLLWGKLMSQEWYSNMWKTIKTDKHIFNGEILNHRKNGEKFTSMISIYPLLDDLGEVKYFVATQRDITHEKAIDLMKTDFISIASHQLRTPLSAMKWFLEMLLVGDFGQLSKEQKDAVDNIEESNERMIDLVNGLLNISRIESGRIIIEPEPTDIAELTNSVITEVQEKFNSKKQKIALNCESIPLISLDTKLIRQVILNLLTNANKYSQIDGVIEVNITKDDKNITFAIKDTGYGIPETEQNRIFERFFRASNITKRETDGTGLGLYLAKTIISSSGGKIWFVSREGEGTTFFFTLPISGMKPKAGEVRLG
ncbi:MAG: PAS domain-containing sensor histidine kinase [bacterium]